MGDYNKIGEGVVEVPTPGGSIRFAGQIKNRIKAKYENWLEAQARRRVFDLKSELTPEEYHESMQAVQEAVGAGTFRWGGAAMVASLKQIPGLTRMIVLLAEEVPQANGKKVDESMVLDLMSNPEVAPVIASAFNAVIGATPNFLTTPKREDLG